MTKIENIYKEIDTLMNQIEGEDAVEEVEREYVAYDNNAKLLLSSQDTESYLLEYEKICTQDTAVIECFDTKNHEELKNYITEKNISFDDLQIETITALKAAVEFLIYEAEEEEY